MNNRPYILRLQTMPASSAGHITSPDALRYSSMPRYRKELIKVGKYVKDSTKQAFEVTKETLEHWVSEFNKWVNAGNRVPIPLGHAREGLPEANQGWVTAMVVEGKSLFGIMEILDPDLALTTDVSICVEPQVVDGKGHKYKSIITHVALCTDPVVPGLGEFETLSLSKGIKNMEFLKKMAAKFGLKDENPTEDLILSAVDSKLKDPVEGKVALSAEVVVNPLAKLVSDNRAMKLSQMVKAGLITPAISTLITERYVEAKTVALELSKGVDDGFDVLCKVLLENKPVNLNEVTGVQSLELSNLSVDKPNAMEQDVNRRRKEAGLKD